MPNQIMTAVDETLKIKNSPSEASEQAAYNHGYSDGVVKCLELVITEIEEMYDANEMAKLSSYDYAEIISYKINALLSKYQNKK